MSRFLTILSVAETVGVTITAAIASSLIYSRTTSKPCVQLQSSGHNECTLKLYNTSWTPVKIHKISYHKEGKSYDNLAEILQNDSKSYNIRSIIYSSGFYVPSNKDTELVTLNCKDNCHRFISVMDKFEQELNNTDIRCEIQYSFNNFIIPDNWVKTRTLSQKI